MAANSKIEWTDATWNPIRARNRATGKLGWFCVHASEGCRFCYAERMNVRPGASGGNGIAYAAQNRDKVELLLDEKMLAAPLHWRAPRMIFVCSMTDLFADFVPDWMIDRIFAVMALCPQHIFQILTKRPERMREYLNDPATVRRIYDLVCDMVMAKDVRGIVLITPGCEEDWAPPGRKIFLHTWPLPNVWLGTSCEDQPSADARIPHLLETPAAIRFLSCEPTLGLINLRRINISGEHGKGWFDALASWRDVSERHPDLDGQIDWIIAGGESGPGARPMHPDWARSLRDQCTAAGVPFFFKQWGEWLHETHLAAETVSYEQVQRGRLHRWPDETVSMRVGKRAAGHLLDGRDWNQFPATSDNPTRQQ